MATLVTFLCATVLLLLVIVGNFYQQEIYLYMEAAGLVLPAYFIPLASFLFIFGILLTFWHKQAENERMKHEFVTIVTHKFRTPLTGIRWAIEMLHKDITMQQKDDILTQIQTTNERLMEIVDLLVGFLKFDRGLGYAYEAVSLRELVEKSLEKSAQQMRLKNLSFDINVPQSLPMLHVDRSKIQFVIDMLIDNAIKYTPDGGKITIVCEWQKKSILLSVHDTGIGINATDMRHMFKPFFRSVDAKTADTEGMGLGLSTVKRIVAKHNARLWAESSGKDKGSTFFVEFRLK